MQGSAVKAGMMIARGQHLLMADADGATRTSDLAQLEDALRQLNDPGKLSSASGDKAELRSQLTAIA